MTHTTNFNLSQWAKSDRIQMADFNADNAKIDAALAALNSRFYLTTYTGDGASTRTFTFPHKPMAIFIARDNYISIAVALQGCPRTQCFDYDSTASPATVWDGDTVTMTFQSHQLRFVNFADNPYTMFALLDPNG